jgi:3-phosphoshikimate 1-carboxyvinyltransferase
MREELEKMGGRVEELEDGLLIKESELSGCRVHGHDDHRVVMALAVAGLGSKGQTEVDTAEAVSVTFPNFKELMKNCGADIKSIE